MIFENMSSEVKIHQMFFYKCGASRVLIDIQCHAWSENIKNEMVIIEGDQIVLIRFITVFSFSFMYNNIF